MYVLFVVLHVFVCFLMIGAILLQSGKGAEIGAAFGGSSQTVFGSRGPANFLSKLTVIAACVFMITSFSLAILAKQRTFSSTVIDLNKKESTSPPATPPAETPATPAPQSQSTTESSSSAPAAK